MPGSTARMPGPLQLLKPIAATPIAAQAAHATRVRGTIEPSRRRKDWVIKWSRIRRRNARRRACRTHVVEQVRKGLDGKVRGLAQVDQLALLTAEFACHFRDLGGNRQRHGVDAMPIAMYEIPRIEPQPADFNRQAPVNDVRVRVAGRDAP